MLAGQQDIKDSNEVVIFDHRQESGRPVSHDRRNLKAWKHEFEILINGGKEPNELPCIELVKHVSLAGQHLHQARQDALTHVVRRCQVEDE